MLSPAALRHGQQFQFLIGRLGTAISVAFALVHGGFQFLIGRLGTAASPRIKPL